MKKIFIGLFFAFINFNINGLELMPAFVGYILIYLGLGEEGECPCLQTARIAALVGAVVSGLLWLMEMMGPGISVPVGAVFQLLVTYWLVKWAEELAPVRSWDAGRLKKFRASWHALAISIVLCIIFGFLQITLVFAALLAFAVSAGYYIYTFYHIWKDRPPADWSEE